MMWLGKRTISCANQVRPSKEFELEEKRKGDRGEAMMGWVHKSKPGKDTQSTGKSWPDKSVRRRKHIYAKQETSMREIMKWSGANSHHHHF